MCYKLIYIIALSVLLSSCATQTIEKTTEESRAGIYATSDSIQVNRFDLAKQYIAEVTKLVPPPKKRIKITPFINETTKERFVVVPKDITGKVVVVGSDEYNNLLKNKDLANKLKRETSVLIEYGNQVENRLMKVEEINSSLLKENNDLKIKIEKQSKEKFKYIALSIGLASIIVIYLIFKISKFF